MKLLCEIENFKQSLDSCVELLRESALADRKLGEAPQSIQNMREFLKYLRDTITPQVTSYEQLVGILQTSQLPQEFNDLAGLMGKILDAVQILKPHSRRHEKVVDAIAENLERTGHEFVWHDLREGRSLYEKELVSATATYQLLEAAFLADAHGTRNPIATLRNSMGERLPEEYFSELLAGWMIEDALKTELESKDFACILEWPDSERGIQLARPTEMGVYDFRITGARISFRIELQRVGKFTRPRGSNVIKTYLRRHKYDGGDSRNKILILWIGRPSQERYHNWSQKMLLLSNIKGRENVHFADEHIYVPIQAFDDALTWEEFRQKTHDEIARLLRNS